MVTGSSESFDLAMNVRIMSRESDKLQHVGFIYFLGSFRFNGLSKLI